MSLPFPKNVLRDLAHADPHAVEQLAGFGPNIFNPIIGTTPAKTCSNIAMVAACVVGQLGTPFNAVALMDRRPGSTGDVQRLVGIGQEIADRWRTHFEEEAKKLGGSAAGGLQRVGAG